jgi:acyl-CoA thioesterase FadM
MNLYLRLLLLLLRQPWSKTIADPLTKVVLPLHTWPNDLDLNLHMNNGRYLTLMDLARFDLMVKTGILGKLFRRGWHPVLGEAKITYMQPLKLFQKFYITTQILYWDKKWIYVEHQFIYQEQLYATALLKGLFISKQGKITPQQVLALLPYTINQPPLPSHLAQWINPEQIDPPTTDNSISY